jgi:imidazolonepropionase-like amidohydrolase
VLGKDLGTVEPGKVADPVVVGADLTADVAGLRKVHYIVRGGAVRPIGELAAAAR